jgi:hypothetical protein
MRDCLAEPGLRKRRPWPSNRCAWTASARTTPYRFPLGIFFSRLRPVPRLEHRMRRGRRLAGRQLPPGRCDVRALSRGHPRARIWSALGASPFPPWDICSRGSAPYPAWRITCAAMRMAEGGSWSSDRGPFLDYRAGRAPAISPV